MYFQIMTCWLGIFLFRIIPFAYYLKKSKGLIGKKRRFNGGAYKKPLLRRRIRRGLSFVGKC